MTRRKNLTTAFLCLVFIIGAGLIAYPTFSDWWNSFHQSRAILSYAEAVSNMDDTEYERLIGEAEEYNRALSHTGVLWEMTEKQEEEYLKELSFNNAGIMGYIDIPKIRITLPLYHGISERVLQTSIGHIEGTSLPVGGEGSHCVLSGHRGLPSAKLFTDLDKLQPGDTWTITVLNETLTYECDQILVVLPEDISPIRIFPGQDYCTLLTCTPYGINTHRLLVRGHRIRNAQGDAKVVADAIQIQTIFVAPFFAIPVLLLLFFRFMLTPAKRRDKERDKEREELL